MSYTPRRINFDYIFRINLKYRFSSCLKTWSFILSASRRKATRWSCRSSFQSQHRISTSRCASKYSLPALMNDRRLESDFPSTMDKTPSSESAGRRGWATCFDRVTFPVGKPPSSNETSCMYFTIRKSKMFSTSIIYCGMYEQNLTFEKLMYESIFFVSISQSEISLLKYRFLKSLKNIAKMSTNNFNRVKTESEVLNLISFDTVKYGQLWKHFYKRSVNEVVPPPRLVGGSTPQ